MIKRISNCLLGNIGISISVSFIMFANLGNDPFNTLIVGLNNTFNLGLGTTIACINLIFFIIMLIFDRKNIGFGTLINCFMNGYLIEFSYALLQHNIEPSLIIRCIFLTLGIIFLCPFVGLYMSSHLGNAPWDDFAQIINNFNPKITYRLTRIIQESIAVIIGFLLKAPIGFATLILALCLGPMINFYKDFLERHLY